MTYLATLIVAALVTFLSFSSTAAIPINLSSPTEFFTNLATRLVQADLSLNLNRLQVYPTNEYTPSVHRLLQVTANLYDSTTNRTLGINPEEPYCPSVFRPLFRRVLTGTNIAVVIAGYREVTNTDLANPMLAPPMIDPAQSDASLGAIPLDGMAFSSVERDEPMIAGIPLVIGARKGFPNFNEFSMQTQVEVTRLLEFRRAAGNGNGPVVATNQMYVVGISNLFGLEAWNSYSNSYPRDVQLLTSVLMSAVLTNELGGTAIYSNSVAQGASTLLAAGSWAGWSTPNAVPASMVLPFGATSFAFLPSSTYNNGPPWFTPLTHTFTVNQGFYVPHWWLNLSVRILFVLVDTNANRIIDYVNLSSGDMTVDVTSTLTTGNTGAVTPNDYRNPANQWLTNSFGNTPSGPTYGIINQIQTGLNGTTDWINFVQDPYAGQDAESAVDGFRLNLAGYAPIYAKDVGRIFYPSNVFYVPFDPVRSIYIHTSWQANDPLVHYTISDLTDLRVDPTNSVDFVGQGLTDLGTINRRYEPWGGNPAGPDPLVDVQIAVKDPGVARSDDWSFPTNQAPGTDWIGAVHRGTPWQTVFLKSTNFLLETSTPSQGLLNWARWTGNSMVWPASIGGLPVFDAAFTAPTNDWHLVSLLNDYFNTNNPRSLSSPNLSAVQDWESLLDGITVLTNTAPNQLTPLVMSSNSPQAALVAKALVNGRNAQTTGLFGSVGDILSTPELSMASPFLNPGNLATISDAALEAIPSHLISRLRPDSVATLIPGASPAVLQFTGMDGYYYMVQSSTDFMSWTTVSTNTPENGFFEFSSPLTNSSIFYRSLLQP